MKRFPAAKGGLDELQTDAILELKLYRLARLEINLIQDELKNKNKRARQIRKLLKEDTTDTNNSGRWGLVRKEIENLITEFCAGPEGKWLGETAEADCRSVQEPFAGWRHRVECYRWFDARNSRVLFVDGILLHLPHDRHSCIDWIWRTDSKTVQA